MNRKRILSACLILSFLLLTACEGTPGTDPFSSPDPAGITGAVTQSPSRNNPDNGSGFVLQPTAALTATPTPTPVITQEVMSVPVSVSGTGDSDAASAALQVAADTVISLTGTSASVTGPGASVQDSTVLIEAAGTYLISGSLEDGQLIVNTTDEEKVTLILNGVELYCSNSAPLYIISSPKKTVINLLSGSVNHISDGTEYVLSTDETEDTPSAAIYSRDDLEFKGSGLLYVNGNYNKGIFSKDDLTISDGTLVVTAADDGIRGKDSVTVSGGSITITAGADGIRTSNEENAEKGYITISGGSIAITAELDAVQAITALTVSGGDLTVTSGGGSINSSTGTTADSWGNWGGMGGRGGPGGPGGPGGRPDTGNTSSATETETQSAKGLKSGSTITITGGTLNIDSSDDSIHSNGTVSVTGGTLNITSGDDGIHADDTLNISDGTIFVSKSYEALEGVHINISGGYLDLTASDDGINAAGGVDGSSTTNRPGRGMGMFSESTGDATFSGGTVIVNSVGDGIDINGSVTLTGGYYIVYGPTNSGNGALDYDGTFTVDGGLLAALGSTGMAQSVTSSTQGVLAFTVSLSSGNILSIQNASGAELLTLTLPKAASCVVFSGPSVQSSEDYNIYINDSLKGTISAG